MADTSLVFNLIAKDRNVSATLARVADQVQTSNLKSKASIAALGVVSISAAAQALALASAVGSAAGAIIAFPSIAINAAASITAFRIGVMNLGAALKTSAASAGGAAFDYAGAEHRVSVALRSSLDAQHALDDARRQAARTIDDLGRSLRRSSLDEESATLAVKRAEMDLRKARRGGNRSDIEEADLAYRESLQTLDDAKHRTQDLAEQQAEASKAGVEGSDAVQQALARQADAVYELAQAQKALKKGASGGGGGADPAAEAFAKLAPAAREVVTAIKAVTPAWQGMAREIQQDVWVGVGADIRQLSALYLPTATAQLGRFGTAWNIAIRETAGLAKQPDTLRSINRMLDNGSTAVQTLAHAVAPLVSAFVDLGAEGSTVLPGIATDVLHIAERFERWIRAAKESGKLKEWVSTGITVVRELVQIAWNLASAIVAVFRAGGGEAGGDGQRFLTWATDASARLAAFLNSTEGQQKLHSMFERLRNIITIFGVALSEAGGAAGVAQSTLSVFGVTVGFLADHLGLLSKALPYIAAGFLVYKASQVASNVAALAMVPIDALRLVSQWGLVGALRAHTAALLANTAGAEVSAVATVASGTAAETASVGFWSLAAALLANPITWIVLAIVALIAIIVVIATKTDWFQRLWAWAWGGIKVAAKFVYDWVKDDLWPTIVAMWDDISHATSAAVDWIVNSFHSMVDFLFSLPARVSAAVHNLWEGLVSNTKAAINTIIFLWNRLDFGIHIRVPQWVPGIGGMGFDIDDIIPDIPMLAVGGKIQSQGLAFLHPGEEVVPAAEVKRRDTGQGLTVRFAGNTDSAFATAFQKLVRGGLIVIE